MGWGLEAKRRKMAFVEAYLRRDYPSVVQLCAAFGVSRPAGYGLLARYAEAKAAGRADWFEERSRAPRTSPQAIAAQTAELLLALRDRHPTWGPRKLRARLGELHPLVRLPAASTIGDLLKRSGRIVGRRRRSRSVPRTRPFAPIGGANETWCLDFKGPIRTGDGMRSDPFTVTDAYSRYCLCCRIVPMTIEAVGEEMERLFSIHGLPDRIRMDNGAPWGSSGAGGVTRLAVGWLKIGIGLEYTEPASPQQNGRHERFHGTLARDTASPPAPTAEEQQARFEAFVRVYNEERPHEALGMATPASLYGPSARARPRQAPEPRYDRTGEEVRRVRQSGEIKWKGALVFIGQAFVGESVGVTETDTGDACVRFANLELGIIRKGKIRRFGAPRPGRTEADANHDAGEASVKHLAGP